jgi:hypothetical protein
MAAVVPDVWIPLASESNRTVSGQPLWGLSVMGRLPVDIDPRVAAARVGVAFRSELLKTEKVPANDVPVLHLTNAAKGALPDGPNQAEEIGAVIAGLAAALLVVVSIHAGNILVTRARLRAPEFSVRATLGATRVRMFNQLAMEAIVLCVVSGIVAVLLYHWTSTVVGTSGLLPPGLQLETDWGVVLLTIVTSLSLAVAFALVSAVRAANDTAASAWTWRNVGRRRASRVVLVVQVATTVLLLSGAVSMAQLASRWRAPDLTFDPAKIVVVGLSADGAGTDSASLASDLRSAALTLPGVTAAAVTGPFWEESTFGQVFTSGERIRLQGRWFPIDPYLCDTLSLSLVGGRCFRTDEAHGDAAVAVLSESAATVLYGRTNAVGRSMAFDPQGRVYTVVGVVRDVWGAQMAELSNPIVFLPIGVTPGDIHPSEARRVALQQNPSLSLVARLDGPSPQLRSDLERLALSGTPVTTTDVETVASRLARQAEPLRLVAAAWWAFGAAALMLSAIGLYALVDHQIASRRREFGIRLALGAKPIDVAKLALKDTAVVVSLGLVTGCALSALGALTGRAMVIGAPEMTWQVLLIVVSTVIASSCAAVVNPLCSIRTQGAASLLRCD